MTIINQNKTKARLDEKPLSNDWTHNQPKQSPYITHSLLFFLCLSRVFTFPMILCIYIEFTSFLMINDVSPQNANIMLQVARSLGNQNIMDCAQH